LPGLYVAKESKLIKLFTRDHTWKPYIFQYWMEC